MTTLDRHHCRLTGELQVDLPPTEAFRLFTARGEQEWAPDWSPRFPAGPVDDTAAGTVFETDAHGRTTTWIVVDATPGRLIRYARVVPHSSAATVTVALRSDGEGSRVTVTYDLTSLSQPADRELDDFAAGYPAYLHSWQEAIGSRRSAVNGVHR